MRLSQADNLKAKAKKKYRSVVGPADWGEATAPSQPPHTKPARGATAYADMAATKFPDEFY